jgi:hypothetical protein
LENASKEPDHVIRRDERMQEYHVVFGKEGKGQMMIYYCPFCGGRTPKSRRASFFAHVSDQEGARIHRLCDGIRTVADVLAKFGPPDEKREHGLAIMRPEKDGKPGGGECFRELVYKKLSPVADVYFSVGLNDSAKGRWMQKHIGEQAG